MQRKDIADSILSLTVPARWHYFFFAVACVSWGFFFVRALFAVLWPAAAQQRAAFVVVKNDK